MDRILGIPNRVIRSTPRRECFHHPRHNMKCYTEDRVDEGPQEVEAMDKGNQEIEVDIDEE